MQVILNKDVKGTGKKGDLVNVSDGFGRNFLIKKGLAVAANNTNINANKQIKQAESFHKQAERNALMVEANKLNNLTIEIPVKIGENGKFFGSVTNKEVAERLNSLEIKVEKRMIDLPLIKLVGKYNAKAHFAEGIEAKFFVSIIAE